MHKRTRELNHKNFPSEAWFERLLFEHQIGNYSRNPPLIGKYFGDFVWFSHGIIVEIDGSSHVGKEDYDKKRDEQLTKAGFKVCRIKVGDTEHAFRVIQRLKEVLGIASSFRAPPPIYRKARKKRKVRKAKQKHGQGKKMASCYTDDNARILREFNKRRALWVPRSKRMPRKGAKFKDFKKSDG